MSKSLSARKPRERPEHNHKGMCPSCLAKILRADNKYLDVQAKVRALESERDALKAERDYWHGQACRGNPDEWDHEAAEGKGIEPEAERSIHRNMERWVKKRLAVSPPPAPETEPFAAKASGKTPAECGPNCCGTPCPGSDCRTLDECLDAIKRGIP